MTDAPITAGFTRSAESEHYEAVSPWWLSGTPLDTEHQRLMRRRQLEIPWEQSTAGELTAPERARLAETWKRRSAAEYLAVSTFSILAIDLVAAGAPADVLSHCVRAQLDEIRHAELAIRMVEIYGGSRIEPVAGMSRLPDSQEMSKLQQAVANTLLVSCVSETYATTVLTATRDLTTDPVAHAVLTSIYSDEVMHARLGWSYLRFGIEKGGKKVIEAASAMVPRAVKGVATVVERERPVGEVTEAVRRHGLMTPGEERKVFSQTVREVLVPGFQALGIDCGNVVEEYGDAWADAA